MERNYIEEQTSGGVPLKMWTRGVPVEDSARRQLENAARLPIVFRHVAAMPDVHFGIGATVGSVIPTLRAIIPAAVGVDIGCGMIACKTTLAAEDLPDNLAPLRAAIERAVPHGRAPGARDPGAWCKTPARVDSAWAELEPEFRAICRDHPKLEKTNHHQHLGTLGSGNHFVEVCLDESGAVWFMLHSGSRGVGNAIGTMFIELARQDALRNNAHLPDRDLAYFEEGARHFGDYVRAVGWAQRFAAANREVMMKQVIEAAKTVLAKAAKADPATWGQLVEQFSSQRGPRPPTTAPNELAGDLGIVGPPGHPRGGNPRVPDAVREAAFKMANLNETYGTAVEADKKFYVIRITSKTEGRARTFDEAQRAIRTAVVQSRLDEREKALEKDLRSKFPVKVDDAALEKMPMPAPSAAPAAMSVPAPGGPAALRGPGGMPGMPRMPGLAPTPAPQ